MYYFCTYFDQHYLDKGLALYHSLTMHCSPFRLWILCMDEVSYRILASMQLPQVHLITLPDFEKDYSQVQNAKQNRSLIEYYFTCTPFLPLYVMDHEPEVDIVTYLDADLYFFSSIEPVYQELGDGSVLIIGHRFPPILKNREIFGLYNVGLLSFRRDNNGRACLHWWRDRCIEWCYDRLENGRFADQKYLDEWPDRFAGVVVLQHKGAGLAPWNLANYGYSWKNHELLIDGQPIIVYHFHGIKRMNRWICDTNIIGNKTRLPGMLKKGLYITYLKELNQVHRNLEKYEWNNPGKEELTREFTETSVLLKMKKFKILLYPLFFFLKWVNNDLILIKMN